MKGLFVPVSKNKEWLIKWWWMNYTLNCALPVTFIQEDEVSKACLAWCKERSAMKKFDVTLWIEPWCQIYGPLEPLFEFAKCEAGYHPVDSNLFVFKKAQNRIDFLKINSKSTFIINWHDKLLDLKDQISDLASNSLYQLSF